MIVVVFFYILRGVVRPFMIMLSKLPGANFVNTKIENLKYVTNQRIHTARETAFRSGVVLLVIGIIIWLAIFMYVVFYYTYIPSLTHTRPIYIQFKTCDDAESTICSFPTAHIQLTKKQQLLMVGQSYKIYLNLEMPESEANQNLGMFMVCLELTDKDGTLVGNSCRPVMLHYKSWLLQTMKTLVLSPLLLLGTAEEKQIVSVEMFSHFEENQNRPVTDVYIEIHSKRIELYSATMQIHAHFTGLRYLMFHWPITSAVFGIGANLLLIVFIMVLSWYHLFYRGDEPFSYTRNFQRTIPPILEEKESLDRTKIDESCMSVPEELGGIESITSCLTTGTMTSSESIKTNS